MRFKKVLAVIMAATTVTSMSVSAFAIPATYTHAIVTDEDGFDKVWVELTDENSTYSEETHQRTLNDDALEEGRVVEEYESNHGTDLTKIGDEITNVAALTVGETYDFIEGGYQQGDIISGAVEGGAELTFLGEGKIDHVTNGSSSSDGSTPLRALQKDISSMEKGIEENDIIEKVKNNQMSDDELSKYLAGTMTKATAQEISEMTYDELIEKYLKNQYEKKAGEDYDEEACRQYVAQHKEEQKQMLAEALPFYKEQIKAMKSVDMTIYKEKLAQFKSVLPQDIENPTDAEIEAICTMYGLTTEQIYTMTQNRKSSHMILMPNSGFVDVVKPGTGFDECEQGMLEYFEGRGWMYGCTGGGVAFGEAEGLKLNEVEKIELPANAYTVIPVNAIQLDKNGNGTVQLKDIKAQFEIDNVMYDIKSFEFLDQYVCITNGRSDVHATVLIGGRPFTLTFNLLAWKENPEKPVPVEIVPVKEEFQNTEPTVQAQTQVQGNKFVSKDIYVSGKSSAKQLWFGFDYTSISEKKVVSTSDVTKYLNECIANGKQYITFTPSGMDTKNVVDLNTALSTVANKDKVKGLDFTELDIKSANFTNAFAGYTNLEILVINNWIDYNQTFPMSGLGSGKTFYYNELTNPEYIKYLTSIGCVGVKSDINFCGKKDFSDAFKAYCASIKPQTFIYDAKMDADMFAYLVGLGWTPVLAE